MQLILREWQVAYRLCPQGSLLTDRETPFIAVSNTLRYTAADPFLFTENGTTYLFAELYDKKEERGKLGYAVFQGAGFSPWKVIISEPYHLSYPNLFRFQDDIFMVPESNESRSLYAYRAVEFPDRWEKCAPIVSDRRLVDTTFLSENGAHWMFSYEIEPADHKRLYRCSILPDGTVGLKDWECLSCDDASARPGGNFFSDHGDWIRVSQDCKDDYGAGLVFSRVIECSAQRYAEQPFLHLSPADVKINKRFVTGLHTYNANESMEVIDFHVPDFDPMTQVRRVKGKLGWKRKNGR